jgi:hypothetical protein
MANHALHVRTIAGTDWEWAFSAPVLSANETNWWSGNHFNQLYNQGQARDVSDEKLVFDWLTGVRTDRLLLANNKVFNGWARPGQEWKVGDRTVRLAAINEQAGTVQVEVLEAGRSVFQKTLGPIQRDRLIEDDGARKALLFEYGDVAGFLSPWPEAFRNGEAQMKVYGDVFSIRYGQDYAQDPRFTVYRVGCPTGHNFGIMWVNKEPMVIPAGGSVTGPESYFKVAVDSIQNGEVLAWHVEDRQGNRSANLGGPDVENVDLVLGQGRVAGQAILKDVGRAALERTYNSLVRSQTGQSVTATGESFPWGVAAGTAVLMLALFGIVSELRSRFGRPARLTPSSGG